MSKMKNLIAALGMASTAVALDQNTIAQNSYGQGSYLCEVTGNTAPAPTPEARPGRAYPKPLLAPAPRNHLRNAYDEKNLMVYFLTNSWTLYDNDKRDVRAYLKSLPANTDFILEGYADFRGSIEDNLQLGENRAHGVAQFTRMNGFRDKISETIMGEKGAQPEGTPIRLLGKDRRVSIIPNESVISRGLSQLPGDSYLLDQSSSMSGDKWREVQSYKFPRGSKQYTFTSTARRCGTNIKNEYPTGQTPLYVSLVDLIGRTEKSKKITVLTDGMNNMGGSPYDVIKVANEKGIHISFIGLYLPRVAEIELAEIATKTGGKVNLAR
ncbi:MAG TPA: hypothetical protein VJH04_02760 [archaeon]|nr:hypothetical protein [archaeon]